MAQADQPTPINDLDDLLRYLTEDSGYTKGVAEYMANQRYKDGHLRLTKVEYVGVKPQGEVPINPKFGHIELHRGRMRFVPREPLWRKTSYRIAEGCDVRAIWPPHPQQPENKAGPDPFKTGADRPVAAQRRPTKAAKPGSRAAARDAAINSRLANGKRPGSTVTWMKFCDSIRTDCGAVIVDVKKLKFERGFSDDYIEEVTRKMMKLLTRQV